MMIDAVLERRSSGHWHDSTMPGVPYREQSGVLFACPPLQMLLVRRRARGEAGQQRFHTLELAPLARQWRLQTHMRHREETETVASSVLAGQGNPLLTDARVCASHHVHVSLDALLVTSMGRRRSGCGSRTFARCLIRLIARKRPGTLLKRSRRSIPVGSESWSVEYGHEAVWMQVAFGASYHASCHAAVHSACGGACNRLST
jgi:hypothetical protein